MPRKLTSLLVLCAWLLSSGAQWDVLQGYAWGRMIVEYSRSMSVAEAVRRTFTADQLCGLCEFVAEGKTRADSSGSTTTDDPSKDPNGKSPAIYPAGPGLGLVFSALPTRTWSVEHLRPVACARPAPPTEPPRVA